MSLLGISSWDLCGVSLGSSPYSSAASSSASSSSKSCDPWLAIWRVLSSSNALPLTLQSKNITHLYELFLWFFLCVCVFEMFLQHSSEKARWLVAYWTKQRSRTWQLGRSKAGISFVIEAAGPPLGTAAPTSSLQHLTGVLSLSSCLSSLLSSNHLIGKIFSWQPHLEVELWMHCQSGPFCSACGGKENQLYKLPES